MVARVARPDIYRPPTTAEAIAVIGATHEARKREKMERHKLADWLVDLLFENRNLRTQLHDIKVAASDGGRISADLRFGNPHLAELLDLIDV